VGAFRLNPRKIPGAEKDTDTAWANAGAPGAFAVDYPGRAINGDGDAVPDMWDAHNPERVTGYGIVRIDPNGMRRDVIREAFGMERRLSGRETILVLRAMQYGLEVAKRYAEDRERTIARGSGSLPAVRREVAGALRSLRSRYGRRVDWSYRDGGKAGVYTVAQGDGELLRLSYGERRDGSARWSLGRGTA
jgi:hypothetical protein